MQAGKVSTYEFCHNLILLPENTFTSFYEPLEGKLNKTSIIFTSLALDLHPQGTVLRNLRSNCITALFLNKKTLCKTFHVHFPINSS